MLATTLMKSKAVATIPRSQCVVILNITRYIMRGTWLNRETRWTPLIVIVRILDYNATGTIVYIMYPKRRAEGVWRYHRYLTIYYIEIEG